MEDLDGVLGETESKVVVIVVPQGTGARSHLSGISDEIGAYDGPVMVVCDATSSPALSIFRWIDDFVLRPVRQAELVTRLERLTRRHGQPRDVVAVGLLSLDTKSFEVTFDGDRLGLTYQEFRLLRFLMQHPGEAFGRDQLLARVWSYDYYGGPRTVDIHVRRLRAKLEEPYAACLETVRCVGYRWSPERLETP
jgi:DNA-binding response OmpR family regulator